MKVYVAAAPVSLQRVPVRIGHVGSGAAEVLSGVPRGERVVVFPPDLLRAGMRVRAAD